MELELSDFIEGIKTPTSKLTITQLRAREEVWRALWSWLDDDVKPFLLHAGGLVRVVRRDYKSTVGELGQVKFEPSEIEVAVYEKAYDYNTGNQFFERKVVKIPSSVLAWHELISSKTPAEEEEYSVDSIPDTEEVGA